MVINVIQYDGVILKININGMMVSGMNSEGVFFIYNYVVDNVLLENGGYLDINVYGLVNKMIIKDKGIMLVLINVKVDVI